MWGPYYGMYLITAKKQQEKEEKKFNEEKEKNPEKFKNISFIKFKLNFFS